MSPDATIGCATARDLLAGYAGGKLDRAETSAVASHVGLCRECAAELSAVEATLKTVSMVRSSRIAVHAGAFGEIMLRVQPRNPASASPTAGLARRFTVPAAAACLLALLLGAVSVLSRPSSPGGPGPCVFLFARGEVEVLGSGVESAVLAGAPIPAGSRIRTGPGGELRMRAGRNAEIGLLPGTTVLVPESGPVLSSGRVFVRATGPFAMRAGGVGIEVLGTEFFAEAAGDAVFVDLVRGQVVVSAMGGSATLRPGDRAEVSGTRRPAVFPAGFGRETPAIMADGPLVLAAKVSRTSGGGPGMLDIEIANVSGDQVVIGGFNPAYPGFALEFSSGGEGAFVLNLSAFFSSSNFPGEGEIPLPAGGSYAVRFDLSGMSGSPAVAPGRKYAARAIYRSPARAGGLFAGKLVSDAFDLVFPQAGGKD